MGKTAGGEADDVPPNPVPRARIPSSADPQASPTHPFGGRGEVVGRWELFRGLESGSLPRGRGSPGLTQAAYDFCPADTQRPDSRPQAGAGPAEFPGHTIPEPRARWGGAGWGASPGTPPRPAASPLGAAAAREGPQPSRGAQGRQQVRAPLDPSPRQPPAPPPRASGTGPRDPAGPRGVTTALSAGRPAGRRQAFGAGTPRPVAPGAPGNGERVRRPPQGKRLGWGDPGTAPKPRAAAPPGPAPRSPPLTWGAGEEGPCAPASRSPVPGTAVRAPPPGGRGAGSGGGSDGARAQGATWDRRGTDGARGSCAAQPPPTWWRASGVT